MEITSTCIVTEPLYGDENYARWSIQLKNYLHGRELWEVVDPDQSEDIEAGPSNSHKNSAALHIIDISCSDDTFSLIKDKLSAREAWSALKAEYGPQEKETVIKRESPLESAQQEPEAAGTEDPYWEIYRNICDQHLDTTQAVLDRYPEAVRMTFTNKENLLHAAIRIECVWIVEKLLEQMTDDDIEMRRVDNFTPLDLAITNSSLYIAKLLIKRHRKLASMLTMENSKARLPIQYAIVKGEMEIVYWLYSVTPIEDLALVDDGVICATLLSKCISNKHWGTPSNLMYLHYAITDIAIDMLRRAPELAITVDHTGRMPVELLVTSKHLVYENEKSLVFWQRWIYKCISIPSFEIDSTWYNSEDDSENDRQSSRLFLSCVYCFSRVMWLSLHLLCWLITAVHLIDVDSMYQDKLAHKQTVAILEAVLRVITKTNDKIKLKELEPHLDSALKQAAREGNIGFMTAMLCMDTIQRYDLRIDIYKEVIGLAIEYRCPEVASFDTFFNRKPDLISPDKKNSNFLHKVAIIASPKLLSNVPGAALQMQRELQWFKMVQNMAPSMAVKVTRAYPCSAREKREPLTPREIFTKTHSELVIEGTKWMKDMANSCTFVGALIITVTFAAAFTFPGGNEQTQGFPMFINKKLFRVFTILNAVALSASTTSVLMFLGILTARYAEEDFLTSLPRKLIIGISTLFLSIAAMLMAFCIGLSVMFQHELWIVIPSAILASIPIATFVAIQFPLLVKIYLSTYGRSIFETDIVPGIWTEVFYMIQ